MTKRTLVSETDDTRTFEVTNDAGVVIGEDVETKSPPVDRLAVVEAKLAAVEALAMKANVTAQEVAVAVRDGKSAR